MLAFSRSFDEMAPLTRAQRRETVIAAGLGITLAVMATTGSPAAGGMTCWMAALATIASGATKATIGSWAAPATTC